MGLFSDKCKQCGARVKKAATHCSQCGAPAPRGMTKCGACGANVGTDSSFCWKCGADLQAVAPAKMVDERWVRQPGEIAVRVDAKDLEGRLRKGLVVEPGTQALFLQRGKPVGPLGPGKYDVDGFLSRINNFNLKSPAWAVLVSATDMVFRLKFPGLRTREGVEIGVECQVVLSIADSAQFVINFMAGRNRVMLSELQESLVDEVRSLLQAATTKASIEELYGNIELTKTIEDLLVEEMSRTLERTGLSLVHLTFVNYFGDEYEKLQKSRGEIYMGMRAADEMEERAKIHQRILDTLTKDKMAEFKSEKDFEEFVRQTEHELGLKDVIRQAEMTELKRTFAEKVEDREIARRHMIETLEKQHQIAMERLEDEYDLEDATRWLKLTQQMKEQKLALAKKLQDMELAKKRGEQEIAIDGERAKAEIRAKDLDAKSRASVESLIASSDPHQVAALVELDAMRQKHNMTPEQLVTIAGEKSPEMALALAEKYKAEVLGAGGRLADAKETAKEQADRLERLARDGLDKMARVGETRGAGVVVTGPGSISSQPGGQGFKCPKCGVPLQIEDNFCFKCGHKLSG